MTKHVSLNLDDQSAAFVDKQIEAGNFASLEDAIQAGLRLLEHDAKLKTLRAALDEGEASGFIEDFDFDDFLAEKNAAHIAANT